MVDWDVEMVSNKNKSLVQLNVTTTIILWWSLSSICSNKRWLAGWFVSQMIWLDWSYKNGTVIVSSQIVECHNCGMQGQVGESCIKCNTKLYRILTQPLYVIDVAHSGEDREDAIRKVTQGIEISLSGNHRGIKVIHGRSSKSGQATIKNYVLPLLRKEAKRLKARLIQEKNNPGAHILYFDWCCRVV